MEADWAFCVGPKHVHSLSHFTEQFVDLQAIGPFDEQFSQKFCTKTTNQFQEFFIYFALSIVRHTVRLVCRKYIDHRMAGASDAASFSNPSFATSIFCVLLGYPTTPFGFSIWMYESLFRI